LGKDRGGHEERCVDEGWAGFGGTAAWTIGAPGLALRDEDEQRRMAFTKMRILGCIARYTEKGGVR
jgi:hypothetical protein